MMRRVISSWDDEKDDDRFTKWRNFGLSGGWDVILVKAQPTSYLRS